jgi:hypothetical protein
MTVTVVVCVSDCVSGGVCGACGMRVGCGVRGVWCVHVMIVFMCMRVVVVCTCVVMCVVRVARMRLWRLWCVWCVHVMCLCVCVCVWCACGVRV